MKSKETKNRVCTVPQDVPTIPIARLVTSSKWGNHSGLNSKEKNMKYTEPFYKYICETGFGYEFMQIASTTDEAVSLMKASFASLPCHECPIHLPKEEEWCIFEIDDKNIVYYDLTPLVLMQVGIEIMQEGEDEEEPQEEEWEDVVTIMKKLSEVVQSIADEMASAIRISKVFDTRGKRN